MAWEGKLVVLADVLRPVKLFIENTPALHLLQFMQRERQRLAMLTVRRVRVTPPPPAHDIGHA